MWSRALRVPLYINGADRSWFRRAGDIDADDRVEFWTGTFKLLPNVRLYQCGGHFPGSSVLHWDRDAEPDAKERPYSARGGLLLTADTIMVQADRRGFTFIWSAPNWVSLGRWRLTERGFW